MNVRRPLLALPLAALCLAAIPGVGSVRSAQAQHTPDPYNIVGEYNNQYEPYMYADYPNTPGMQPNQARLEGRTGGRSVNNFQNFLDSENDDSGDNLNRSAAPRQTGPGTPYYKAYRRFDQEFQRTYRPNETADRGYYNDQDKRNDKYFQALREPDPQKRSKLLRDYNLDNMRAARDLSTGRTTTERDREPPRDRFTPGGSSLYPEADPEDPRSDRPAALTTPPRSNRTAAPLAPGSVASRTGSGQPAASAPAPRRAPASSTPSLAPPARGRTGTLAPRSLAPTPRSTVPAANRPGTAPSASRLLDRSELLERASRATAPVLPGSRSTPAP